MSEELKLRITAENNTQDGINKTKQSIKGLENEIKKLKSLDLGADTTALKANRAEIAKLQTQLRGLRTDLRATEASMNGMARVAQVALAGIGIALGKATYDAAKFERQFANVVTNLDFSSFDAIGKTLEEGTKWLREGAIENMRKYGTSIDEVTGSLFDIVSASVPAADALKILNESTKLAIAGNVNVKETTDLMTTAYNVFGQDATKVARMVFGAQKVAKAEIGDFAKNLGTIFPIAKQAGVGMSELLAELSLMTLGGIELEEGTTALRQAISSIIAPSKGAEKIFKQLGISYGANALKGGKLGKVMEEISQKTKGNSQVMSELIPNIRAFTAIAALGDKGLQRYDETLQQIENDTYSLDNAVQTVEATFAHQSKVFMANVRAMGMSFGDFLTPALAKVMSAFNSLTPVQQKVLVGMTALTIGGTAMYALFAFKILPFFAAGGPFVTGFAAMAAAIHVSTGGLTLIIAAIVATIAIIVVFVDAQGRLNKAIEKNNKALENNKSKIDQITARMKKLADEGKRNSDEYRMLAEALKDTNAEMGKAIEEADKLAKKQYDMAVATEYNKLKNEQFKKSLAKMFDLVLLKYRLVGKGLKVIGTGIRNFFTNMFNSVTGLFNNIYNSLPKPVRDLMSGAGLKVQAGFAKVKEGAENILFGKIDQPKTNYGFDKLDMKGTKQPIIGKGLGQDINTGLGLGQYDVQTKTTRTGGLLNIFKKDDKLMEQAKKTVDKKKAVEKLTDTGQPPPINLPPPPPSPTIDLGGDKGTGSKTSKGTTKDKREAVKLDVVDLDALKRDKAEQQALLKALLTDRANYEVAKIKINQKYAVMELADLDTWHAKQKAILLANYQAELKKSGLTVQDKINLQKNYNAKVLELDKDYANKKLEINQEIINLEEALKKAQFDKNKAEYDKQLKALQDSEKAELTEALKNKETYEAQKLAIAKKYNDLEINLTKNYAKKQAPVATPEQKTEIENKQTELSQKSGEIDIEIANNQIEIQKDKSEKLFKIWEDELARKKAINVVSQEQEIALLEAELNNAQYTADEKLKIEQKLADAKLAIQTRTGKELANQQMASALQSIGINKTQQENLADLATFMGGLGAEQAEISKAMALFDIGIKTYQAAMSAYAFGNALGGPILGGIAAATATAFGAKMLADASKVPKPQIKAEEGAIVGGNSYTGDKVIAGVNSGEMILNEKQQANLLAIANGGGNSNSQPTTFIMNIDGIQMAQAIVPAINKAMATNHVPKLITK